MLTDGPAESGIGSDPTDAAHNFISSLQPGCLVLVAVSGGSDSVGMLVALSEAVETCARTDVRLAVVTVDHRLRLASAEEAEGVAALSARLSVPHEILRWDDEKPSTGVMAEARHARYQMLASYAETIRADVIVVAHTLNDQAETLFMRQQRKSSDATLPASGMASSTLVAARHWVARPFLSVEREPIRQFLRLRRIRWVDDPSNSDAHYERVRVRNRLVDSSERRMLAERAEAAGLRRTHVSEQAAELFVKSCKIHAGVVAEISVAPLLDAPEAGRYLLSTLMAVIGGRPYGPGGDVVARAMLFLKDGHKARMTGGRCLLERRGDHLFILREARDVPECEIAAGETGLWDHRFRIVNRSGTTLTVRAASTVCDAPDKESAFCADLPPGIRKTSQKVFPVINNDFAAAETEITPFLAPFDLFLPLFDLKLARSVAAGFNRVPYPDRSFVHLPNEKDS